MSRFELGLVACSLCIHLIAFDVLLGVPAGRIAKRPPTRLRLLAGHLLAIQLLFVYVVVDCVSCSPCVCVCVCVRVCVCMCVWCNFICPSRREIDHFTPDMLDSMKHWWKQECDFLEIFAIKMEDMCLA